MEYLNAIEVLYSSKSELDTYMFYVDLEQVTALEGLSVRNLSNWHSTSMLKYAFFAIWL